MRLKWFCFLVLAGMLPVMALSELDRGGLSVDFEKCSRMRFKESSPLQNLIPNPDFVPVKSENAWNWRSNYFIIFAKEVTRKDPRYEQAKKQVIWKLEDKVASIQVPESLNQQLTPAVTATIASAWRTAVNLPDENGGSYRIRFRYRVTHVGAGRNFFILTGMNRVLGKWYTGKDTIFKVCPFNDTPNWGYYQKDLVIPAGTRSVELVFRTDGVGKFEFAEPVWSKVDAPAAPVTLKMTPMGFLDSKFVLGQNRLGVMAFIWKRNGDKKDVKFKEAQLKLQLPTGIDFVEVPNMKTISCQKTEQGTTAVVSLQPWQYRLRELNDFDNWLRIGVALRSSLPVGSKCIGTAEIIDEGKVVSNSEKITFEVAAPFVARQPKIFMPGLYHGGPYLNFNEDSSLDSYMEVLKETGFTCTIHGGKRWTPRFRKAGFRRVLDSENYIANGFRIGFAKDRPVEDRYVYQGNSNHWDLENAACPAAIYEKREHFMTKTVPRLKKDLQGCDGLWANWEPYMFAGRGCFCKTCRRKFAEYLKIDEKELAADWPGIVQLGKKYNKQWIRFRSLEHAKLVMTIDEVVREVTGKDSMGFVPGVQVDDMGLHWRQMGFDQETHPIDYAGHLTWIEPWGPYAHWKTENPFVYTKGYSLNVFWVARGVRQAVDRDYPLPNRPKIQAFPQGLQCSEWSTTPESMKLDMLSFFFNGWESSVIYYFPRGYDYRYWKAVAESSDMAAQYEDYVFKGKRMDGQVTLTPQAPYAQDTWLSDELTAVKEKLSMLQQTSYGRNGRVCVAVFNFWLKGEAFFNLKVAGLKRNQKYRVCNGDRLYAAAASRDAFTGRELAEKGVNLHVGTAGCEVFEIVPAAEAPQKGERITPEDLNDFRRKGLPALRKAVEEDREYEKMYAPKKSKVTDISNAGISGKADTGKMMIHFTAPGVKIALNAANLNISSWTVDGKSVIQGDENSGFGAVAFWEPNFLVKSGFIVTEEKKIPGGVEITGERMLLDRDHHQLQRIQLASVVRITDKGRKITVKSKISNASMINASLGVRYNIMSSLLADSKGCMSFVSGGRKAEFHRNLGKNFFRFQDDRLESAVRRLFEVKNPSMKMDSAEVVLKSSGRQAELKFLPEKLFGGIASWDSGRQVAPTIEPCFRQQTLSPGQSFTIQAELTVR